MKKRYKASMSDLNTNKLSFHWREFKLEATGKVAIVIALALVLFLTKAY